MGVIAIFSRKTGERCPLCSRPFSHIRYGFYLDRGTLRVHRLVFGFCAFGGAVALDRKRTKILGSKE